MPYFLGLDSGGTKTACLLVDENGRALGTATGRGFSFRQDKLAAGLETFEALAQNCCGQAGIEKGQITGTCIGLPLYGEDAEVNAAMDAEIPKLFSPVHIGNDVEVGWAGSLACTPGVHLVSGTGSIAFGCDEGGNVARSGGWNEYFGDEGSSYWLALRGLQLFTKQADGRAPQGALYRMVREAYGLDDDFELMGIFEKDMLPYREKVAAYQKIVSDAADAGDASVLPLYAEAGRELAEMAAAVKAQLDFKAQPVPVSYSGGTFKAGPMLLGPLGEALEKQGMHLQAPQLIPVRGAALMAAKRFAPECFDSVYQGLVAQGDTKI